MDCDESAVSSSTPSFSTSSSSSAPVSTTQSVPFTAASFENTSTPEAADAVDVKVTPIAVVPPALAHKTRKTWKRKNAWGNRSYADLIHRAIESSPDKRLTLSQIYDWLIHNIDYFRQNSDSKSSIGWKNSIRHNLSLHSRFIRIQNDGAGKSSWWTVGTSGASPQTNIRRKPEGSNCNVAGSTTSHHHRTKLESARHRMLSPVAWNPQDRLRYYSLVPNSRLPALDYRSNLFPSTTTSPKVHSRFVAHSNASSRSYAAVDLNSQSGIQAVERSGGICPIEYKPCLSRSRWVSNQGYHHPTENGGSHGDRGTSWPYVNIPGVGLIDSKRSGFNAVYPAFAKEGSRNFDSNSYDTSSESSFQSGYSPYTHAVSYCSPQPDPPTPSNNPLTQSLTQGLSPAEISGPYYPPPPSIYYNHFSFPDSEGVQHPGRGSFSSLLTDQTSRPFEWYGNLVSAQQQPPQGWNLSHLWQTPPAPQPKKQPYYYPEDFSAGLERSRSVLTRDSGSPARPTTSVPKSSLNGHYPYSSGQTDHAFGHWESGHAASAAVNGVDGNASEVEMKVIHTGLYDSSNQCNIENCLVSNVHGSGDHREGFGCQQNDIAAGPAS